MINGLNIKRVVAYFFFLLLFFPDKTIGSATFSICIKFISEKPVKTQIYSPLNGYYNTTFENNTFNELSTSQDSLFVKDNLTKPSFITLIFTFLGDNKFVGRCDLLIFPGDSLHITVNPFKSENEWVIFKGSNAKGHELFSKLNFSPARKFGSVRELIRNYDFWKPNFFNRLSFIIDSTAYPFDSLVRRKIISKDFFSLVRKNFKMLFFEDVLHRLVLYPSKQLQKVPWAERVKLANKLLDELPVTDRNIKSLYNSQLYLETCYKFFECRNSGFKSGYDLNKLNITLIKNGKEEIIDKELTHLISIKDYETKRNLWAFLIGDFFRFASGYFTEKTIDQYSRLFPSNQYDELLRDALKKSKRLSDTVSFVLRFPIVLVDSLGNLKNTRSIVDEITDTASNFLIDLWATWCAPCIEEFMFNKKIDSFLIEQNIKKIYISLDNLNNRGNWRKAISKYKLGGYHILSGLKLREEIQELLTLKIGDPTPIPQYFIVNKTGKITKTIMRPSDENGFMSEILSILK